MTAPFDQNADARSNVFSGAGATAELDSLIESALAGGASRLLILAGKPIVCRVNGQLSQPLLPGRVHFSQTQHLVNALLTPEQHAALDKDGAVEINYTPATSGSNGSAISTPVKINIFFGDGAHNLVAFFED